MSSQTQAEKLSFQAEVNQLLHLVTHSIYKNKEIFLRELISNASDAADKLRFAALEDNALYEDAADIKIWIDVDTQAGTITVKDNGIGMSKDDVIQNLGTIAKSGTKEFLSTLSGDQAKDAHLIGQFGVGFYSAFVVSDKVTVKTRKAGLTADQGVLWESDGTGEYTIQNVDRTERGTEIVLHIKAEEKEFLDQWKLRNIITKYSDHIMWPIVMQSVPEEDAKDKTIQEETVNKATALWTLPKQDITDAEYIALYKHITHDFADPLLWGHNKVEGNLEYTILLYIPTHAPFDLWMREHRYGLKLYVQRVFIMDDAEQLLPNYLRFVRGIVDSKDLPLNLSREVLQSNRVVDSIKTGITKRVLDMLDKLSQDDADKYNGFWKEFGQVIKEGLVEDVANKDRIAKLLRFSSTHADSAEQTVVLDDYIKRMQPEQDVIYYITADTFSAAQHSPHLEIFRNKGIEVLLLSDRIDEWMLAHFTEYAGKKLQSVAKGSLDMSKFADQEVQPEQDALKDEFAEVSKKMQEILQDKVKEVRITARLTDSPSCLIMDDQDMSMNLQRIMQAAGHEFPKGKPFLEINPKHPIVKSLSAKLNDSDFAVWANLLFEQALLAEGGKLEDPAAFVKRLNALLMLK